MTETPSRVVLTLVASLYLWAQPAAATLSQPRADLTSAVVGSQVVFAGGHTTGSLASVSDAVDLYDAASDEWSTAALSEPRSHISAATVGSRVLLTGGTDAGNRNSSAVDIYDSASSTWSTDALPTVRGIRLAATVGQSVVFVGDTAEFAVGVPQGAALFDIYDDASGSWTSGTVPGIGLGALSGAAVGSKLLLSGTELQCGSRGYQGCQPVPTQSVAVYDAGTGSWSAARFAGGRTSTQADSFSPVVDIYDSTTDRWSTTQLPAAQALTVGSSGSLAVFRHQQSDARVVLDIFDTATGRWLSRAAPRPGTNPVVSGGRLILLTQTLNDTSATVDVYDLAADAWSTITLSVPRAGPAVATVGTRTLLAGGLSDRSLAAPASDAVDILDAPTPDPP